MSFKKHTIYSFTWREILQLIQDHINEKEKQNHKVEFHNVNVNTPEMIQVALTMWNKDEVTH